MTEPRPPTDPQQNGPPSPLAPWRYWAWGAVLAAAFAYFLWLGSTAGGLVELTYTQFKQEIRAGHVAEVTLRGQEISGRFRDGVTPATQAAREGPETAQRFATARPAFEDKDLMPLLEKHDVAVTAVPQQEGWFTPVVLGLLPLLILVGLFWYASRRMQDQLGGMGSQLQGFTKSQAKRYQRSESEVRFGDVAGSDNAKRDLQELVAYLQEPDRFRRVGAEIPRGVLLMGPPGTGKTLMAKAVAGEAEVPFFSISGSQFVEMFVGVGASRVRDMFEEAKKEAPAIIFIDEIDAVGRQRGAGLGGGHDEREQTLNQILAEMDGFESDESVVVMAATNRPDVLDPALLRPGRFDRKVTLERPQKRARLEILRVHCVEVPLAEDVVLERIANRTVGFSGADLENLVNEAALLAARDEREAVTAADFDAARDKILFGSEREDLLPEEEKRRVAYHESGHTMVARLLPETDPLEKVTIIPRGRALGATEQMPAEDRYNYTSAYLRARIAVMLGGRMAERAVYEDFSTGAQDDLKQATRLARQMVTQWGMSERLGAVAFQEGEEHVFLGREMAQSRDYSEYTAQVIDQEVSDLISDQERRVADLLHEHREDLQRLASNLMDQETLEAQEVDRLLGLEGGETASAEAEETEQD